MLRAVARMPRLLSQIEAQKIDEELFSDYGFSLDQLMELAGLSVAVAVTKEYPVDKFKNVLVCAGPGGSFLCVVCFLLF